MRGGDDFVFGRRARWAAVSEGSAAESVPFVRRQPDTEVRTDGHDAARIDVILHAVVVTLDVVEVDGVAEPRRLEQIARVRPQRAELRGFCRLHLKCP